MPHPRKSAEGSRVRLAFGRNVRRFRITRGFTQAALAKAAKLSIRYIGLVESGTANPRVDTLEVIANALGVDAYLLLNLDAG
jgi:transcriptional regulator with XRE-family HTH domain